MLTGAELIAQERKRQIEQEGWTAEHDDSEHLPGDLADAARAYTLYAWWQLTPHGGWTKTQVNAIILEDWPWDERWWKPSDDPVRNLEKAGALIAAEIDRFQRQSKEAKRHEQ